MFVQKESEIGMWSKKRQQRTLDILIIKLTMTNINDYNCR